MMSDCDEPPHPVEAPVETTPSRWKLPDGIEDHLESGECSALCTAFLTPYFCIVVLALYYPGEKLKA
jgi:hypothetical protein